MTLEPPDPPPGRLSLEHLLREEDYTFRMRLVRAEPADFFRIWDTSGELLRERRRWLLEAPDRYAPLQPGSQTLIDEWADLAPTLVGTSVEPRREQLTPPGTHTPPTQTSAASDADPQQRWIELACRCEPDLVLLERGADGPRMVAGAVALPSSWAPEEKLGRSLREIHEPVPDLNRSLAASIDAFLSRLSPGAAWLRANWGLTASPELNQHPARALPKLTPAARLESTFLRVEHQALMLLPRSGGWAFGIRVEHLPLTALALEPGLARALSRALASMPDAMARYKGLNESRGTLIDQLAGL